MDSFRPCPFGGQECGEPHECFRNYIAATDENERARGNEGYKKQGVSLGEFRGRSCAHFLDNYFIFLGYFIPFGNDRERKRFTCFC